MAQKIQRTGYMSEIDQFLRDFDKKRTKLPLERIKEIEKHRKIAAKRDNAIEDESSPIWKEF